jgi:single-strand DNA-binding protein
MLNKVILMGRLTKDPELRHTQAGLPVASFSLAVDRGFKTDGQSVDFINIVAWRNTAEFVSKWFSKGQLVAVSGRLQVRSYKDREGYSRVITEVVADEVFFAEKKREAGEIDFGETEAVGLPPAASEDFEELFGEDEQLPF